MKSPFALSHRSDVKELAALSGTPVYQDLLHGESDLASWRLIEAFSATGAPFELELRWSAGSGSGAWAKLTVPHATRVSLFARTLDLRVANLASASNRVGTTVADGFAVTANVWEQRSTCDGVSPVIFAVPPFAATFGLDLADRTMLSTTVLSLYDGAGTLRGQLNADSQPDDGLPVGGVARIQALTPGAIDLRGLFRLSL